VMKPKPLSVSLFIVPVIDFFIRLLNYKISLFLKSTPFNSSDRDPKNHMTYLPIKYSI